MVNLFIVSTSRWVDHFSEDSIDKRFMSFQYEGDTLKDCLEEFVMDVNQSCNEHYLLSFKAHHVFLYQDSDPNTLQVLTDLTPYRKYFKQITCYDWN